MLIRNAQLVPIGHDVVPDSLVDIRLGAREIVRVEENLTPHGDEQVLDAEGRWAIPGLWDQHVHMLQWALTSMRVNTSGTDSPGQVCAIVRQHIDALTATDPHAIVVGFGHRTAAWSQIPTTSELDAVSGNHPVVLISGDAHHGWLNSAAFRLFAVPHQDGPLEENDWFPLLAQLATIPQLRAEQDKAYRNVVTQAHQLGVVGIADLEFESGYAQWAARYASGITSMRVRTASYAVDLEAVIAAGLRSGDYLVGTDGMIQMGPLKIISDGSLNTRTAFCCEPYLSTEPLAYPRGLPNQTPDELAALLRRAHSSGLTVACHALGDQAISDALDAYAATGAIGTIEHAQLIQRSDIARMAQLGLGASVQPAHLLDDRDVSHDYWADRTDRCFAFRSMLNHGVPLLLGSDAPIAPLDPWLAMAAAVHRSGDEREPWNPAEGITLAEALAASTDQQPTLRQGSRPDVVLLDNNPLVPGLSSAEAAARLRSMSVAATIGAGRILWSTLS